jgi:hypothetical protein
MRTLRTLQTAALASALLLTSACQFFGSVDRVVVQKGRARHRDGDQLRRA